MIRMRVLVPMSMSMPVLLATDAMALRVVVVPPGSMVMAALLAGGVLVPNGE